MRTSTWAEVAPKRIQFGAQLRHVGPKLVRSWSQVGPGWAQVGALLANGGPKLSRCCGHVGSKRCIWRMLGRSAKCANCHSPVRGICSYPSLLNDQALVPSVRADFLEHSLYMHVSSFIYIYIYMCVCFKIYILYLYNFTYYQISAFYIYHPDSFPAARMHHTQTHI